MSASTLPSWLTSLYNIFIAACSVPQLLSALLLWRRLQPVRLLCKMHSSYWKALLLCQATCQLAEIAALLSPKTAACLPDLLFLCRLLLAYPTDCCLLSLHIAMPTDCCLFNLYIAACFPNRLLLGFLTKCRLLLLQIELPSYIRPALGAQPTPYPTILHPSHTPASPDMSEPPAPAQGSQPAAPLDTTAPPPLPEPSQGPPPLHDSATDRQLHMHVSQLDRPPSQMDGKTAASPSALLQAPACAVCPAVVGGSCDEGDQPATEVATVIQSPATAVATSDSGLAGCSRTDLGAIEFPDNDIIDVMPCIYLAICLLP